MFDAIDWLWDTFTDALSSLADMIGSSILNAISNFFGTLLFYAASFFLQIVNAFFSVFSLLSGMTKVQYDGEYIYLLNVFFENSTISSIYWGMAMIGIALLFGFAIVAVIRKVFDLGDKEKRSLGQILGSTFKGLLVIVSTTAILTVSIALTNVLIQQVSYVFDQGATLSKKQEIEFTDEQYATMARILNTIGNYSINPGYQQRYNMNSCYNEIRGDLLYLQKQGVFDLVYPDTDEMLSWQGALQDLILANDPNHVLLLDVHYQDVYLALDNIINILRTNQEFYPLQSYKNKYTSVSNAPVDRIIFLSGTMNAAKNPFYNQNPGYDDGLRGAFYTGQKSIYSKSDVSQAFEIGIGGINYVMIAFGIYWVLKSLMRCMTNCAVRIVNIVGLYLIAPMTAATIPLDEGRKFREWGKSIVVQLLGIFGDIIPMRLVLLFLPVVMSSRLILSENIVIDVFARVILVWGMLQAVNRFNGIITGILVDNAAGASIAGMEASRMDADRATLATPMGKVNKAFGDTGLEDARRPGDNRKKDKKKDEQNQQNQQTSGKGGSGGSGEEVGKKVGGAVGKAVGGTAGKLVGEKVGKVVGQKAEQKANNGNSSGNQQNQQGKQGGRKTQKSLDISGSSVMGPNGKINTQPSVPKGKGRTGSNHSLQFGGEGMSGGGDTVLPQNQQEMQNQGNDEAGYETLDMNNSQGNLTDQSNPLDQQNQQNQQELQNQSNPSEQQNQQEQPNQSNPLDQQNQQELQNQSNPLDQQNQQELQNQSNPLDQQNQQELQNQSNPLDQQNQQELQNQSNPLDQQNQQELQNQSNPLDQQNQSNPQNQQNLQNYGNMQEDNGPSFSFSSGNGQQSVDDQSFQPSHQGSFSMNAGSATQLGSSGGNQQNSVQSQSGFSIQSSVNSVNVQNPVSSQIGGGLPQNGNVQQNAGTVKPNKQPPKTVTKKKK